MAAGGCRVRLPTYACQMMTNTILCWHGHPEYSRRPQDKYKYSILPTILCPVSANTHALNPTLTILNTRHHHYTPTQNTYAQNILAPFA